MSRSLQYEYTAPPLDDNSAALAILRRRNVPELAELHQLRRKGWGDEGLDGHFQTQRQVADQSTHASEVFWFEMMKKGIREMDDAVGVVPGQSTLFEFLDVWFRDSMLRRFQLVIIHRHTLRTYAFSVQWRQCGSWILNLLPYVMMGQW